MGSFLFLNSLQRKLLRYSWSLLETSCWSSFDFPWKILQLAYYSCSEIWSQMSQLWAQCIHLPQDRLPVISVSAGVFPNKWDRIFLFSLELDIVFVLIQNTLLMSRTSLLLFQFAVCAYSFRLTHNCWIRVKNIIVKCSVYTKQQSWVITYSPP